MSIDVIKDGVNYDNDHVFYSHNSLQLIPTNICEFLCFKVYGITIPNPDTKHRFGRSTSL